MSQSYGTITVTETATLIVAANCARRNVTIVNSEAGKVVYYGPDASITSANAIPLYENQTRDQDKIPEGYTGAIYGIVASGSTSADVRFWENSNAG